MQQDNDNTRGIDKDSKSNILWHSAQSIDNTSPNIIYEGKNSIPFEQQDKRQKIVSKINNIVSSVKVKKWSNSSDVIIYYTHEYKDFVIESTPKQRDSYNRLSPILTYGSFPGEEKDEKAWIDYVDQGIEHFLQNIERTLSDTTKEMIEKGLKEIRKEAREKKYNTDYGVDFLENAIILSIVIAIPLAIGGILHKQIPLILQELPQQNSQQILKTLQKVIQKLILQTSVLIAINNVLILMIVKLPIAQMLTSRYKTRNK